MKIPTHASAVENDSLVETPSETPPAIDAIIHVSVAADGLEAYLNIEPPSNGGIAPTVESMENALSNYGVTYNIDTEKLKDIEEVPLYNSSICVASGIAPVNGTDGTATFKIRTEKKQLKPKENEDGRVDYHDLGFVENVNQNQVLCTITLPTEGSSGISVRGKELLQKKGRPVHSCSGKNTKLNEDGTAVLSKINGYVEFDGRKINVYDTLYVAEDVDNSTGDIKVSCNLVVSGMVLPGFKIEADGDISVAGTAESSTIRAGRNINLKSGIIGSELYCNGDLKCRFIENCNIFVKGDINAEYIINSEIKCGKNIKITGMKAKIIGGSCIAGQNIEAQTIGSVANVKTRLELGTDQTVIERQQELLGQIKDLKKQIEKLTPLLNILRQLEEGNRLTPEKRKAFDDVSYSYNTNVKLLEDANKELEEIFQMINMRGYGRIICTGTIYPCTHIAIGKASLPVADALQNVSVYYKEGNICIGLAR